MIFLKLWKATLLYKIYYLITIAIQYIKDYKIVGKFFYSEEFKNILSKYLNKEFREDWIGRLYAVVNPNIDINNKLNLTNTIIEFDDDRTNNEVFVNNWIFKQLNLVADVFTLHNMYSYITLKINKVGPKEHDNFLVVFDLASREELHKIILKIVKQLLLYIMIIAVVIGSILIF